jgi:acetylornithine deacetylase/succinyl-diaminopimelate desuccinylase-like protein
MPAVEEDLKKELALGWTEGGGERLQSLLMRPALNLRGLQSAQVGAQARNAIPTEAQASIDFRLVPDQTPEKVERRTEDYLRSLGYWVVHDPPDAETRLAHPKVVRLQWDRGGYAAERTSMDLPVSKAVIRTVEEALGAPVVRVPMLGGSIPIHAFTALGSPVIIVPTVNHDNNQHAAWENLRLQNLWDGIEAFAGLFARLDW